jgi:hypothetical protein
VPDAEVNKYSFLERLCHYMDGITISDANRKCVEWTILFEVGTLVRNMDTMRTADMKARIFSKYVNIDRDIWCAEKCCIGSRLVSRICVVEICCVGGRVKQQLPWKSETATSDRSGTNFREFVGCRTCQVDPIRSIT